MYNVIGVLEGYIKESEKFGYTKELELAKRIYAKIFIQGMRLNRYECEFINVLKERVA